MSKWGIWRHCWSAPKGHVMLGYGFDFQDSQDIFILMNHFHVVNFFLLGNITTKI